MEDITLFILIQKEMGRYLCFFILEVINCYFGFCFQHTLCWHDAIFN